MKKQYIYAAARLHSMENSMLNRQDIERIMALSDFDEGLSILAEKGYDCSEMTTIYDLIDKERKKTYSLVSSLVGDMSVFDVLFYQTDFQNLKAAVMSDLYEKDWDNILVDGGTIPSDEIVQAVKSSEFGRLPEFLRDAAQNARKLFLGTGDASLCHRIIDKACLEAILKKGRLSDCQLIQNYAEMMVAISDIKIALRGALIGEKIEFFRESLAECDSISAEALGNTAVEGEKNVLEYITMTKYSDAVNAWKRGYDAFEKWCDDKIMVKVKENRFNYFTLDVIAAYILAKNTEFKMVRIVLTALKSELDIQKVRERLAELYV